MSESRFTAMPDCFQQVPLLQSFDVDKFQWKASHALISGGICIMADLSVMKDLLRNICEDLAKEENSTKL